MLQLKGIISALVTPVDSRGKLDLVPVPQLIDFLLTRGVNGFFVGGSTGEGFRFSAVERKHLAESVVEHVANRVPVIIHVGSMNFQEVEDLSKHAKRIGADAISSVLPFYYSYSLSEIRDYYQSIADCSCLPIIVYCLGETGSAALDPQRFLEVISTVDRIYGIKYSDGDLFKMQCMTQLAHQYTFFGGVDSLPLSMLVAGAKGLIGSNYSAIPEPWIRLHHAFMDGNLTLATALQDRIIFYLRRLQIAPPIARAKYLLNLRGINVGQPRLPHSLLVESQEREVLEVYRAMCTDSLLGME